MRLVPALAACCAVLAPFRTSAADAPGAELFAGYSHARHDTQETDGFAAGLDVALGRSLGLELVVSRHYDSELGTSTSWSSAMAGPRFVWWHDSVSPFVAVQGGFERREESVEVFEAEISQTRTKAAGQVAAGVEVSVGSRWAVRVQGVGVFRDSFPGEGDQDGGPRWDPQASIGIAYRFGRR
jgi:hypothetical protein